MAPRGYLLGPTPESHMKSSSIASRTKHRVKRRDGYACCVCGTGPADLEICHLMHLSHQQTWLSERGLHAGLDRSHQDNLVTLCLSHHGSMNQGAWCLLPTQGDLDLLIGRETSDFLDRQEAVAAGLPDPGRRVPNRSELSGYFAAVPLRLQKRIVAFGDRLSVVRTGGDLPHPVLRVAPAPFPDATACRPFTHEGCLTQFRIEIDCMAVLAGALRWTGDVLVPYNDQIDRIIRTASALRNLYNRSIHPPPRQDHEPRGAVTSKLSLTDVIPLSLVDRPASLGRGTARRVKQRDGGHCCICGSDMTEVYHLVDKNDLYLHQRAWILERGLNNIIERNCLENLVTLCCQHVNAIRQGRWCLLPTQADLDHLINIEEHDFRSRQEAVAAGYPDPGRCIPDQTHLSGTLAAVPLRLGDSDYSFADRLYQDAGLAGDTEPQLEIGARRTRRLFCRPFIHEGSLIHFRLMVDYLAVLANGLSWVSDAFIPYNSQIAQITSTAATLRRLYNRSIPSPQGPPLQPPRVHHLPAQGHRQP